MKETIIAYFTDHLEAKASSIAEYIGPKPPRTRDYLNELIAEEIVTVPLEENIMSTNALQNMHRKRGLK